MPSCQVLGRFAWAQQPLRSMGATATLHGRNRHFAWAQPPLCMGTAVTLHRRDHYSAQAQPSHHMDTTATASLHRLLVTLVELIIPVLQEGMCHLTTYSVHISHVQLFGCRLPVACAVAVTVSPCMGVLAYYFCRAAPLLPLDRFPCSGTSAPRA